jgi:hypothetical protein
MFNPKISGIAAGIGFLLSSLLGIITGASFPLLVIRALIFAVVFFGLVSAGYWAIDRFLPELMGSSGEAPALGARVDISVGDEFLENPGETGENIDLPGNTLDQDDEDGYTRKGNLEIGSGESAASPEGPAGGLASEGSLFDIEGKAGKKGLEGDFDVQKMASAIQTILKREDKG